MRLAVVVPVLNEAATIDSALRRLAPLRDRGTRVIVVDGGSDDGTAACAAPLADRVLAAPRGRAAQMNAGAQDALARQADVLLFLHADTRLPEDADRVVARALADGAHSWGRFDVRLDADGWSLRLIETMMNWRSRATGIATGDQAIFATRAAFDWLHGFAPLPLMEDVDFCSRARRLTRPAALRSRVVTSARRWQRHGLWRTVLLMWWLRLSYFFGADPQALARRYRDAR
ncbi:MAG: TIGR04283 family arsenosugar biosynthesis glycosyltransferase [Burkholderiaceae bacterium]|jgi:rSAM/selenodomain-associated transferase 2|nr:TIGR04283 family arsenosugar biosynthesis glycosyltransferase [Burkholderiaceae bacterium]